MTKSYRLLNAVEELSTTQIKEHFVATITNNTDTINNLKEVLEFFECNGVEDLSDYENEQRENIYSSLELLHNEIYYLSQLVDYDEIYGSRIKKMWEEQIGKGEYEKAYPNGHIQHYIKDFLYGKYKISDREVA